MTWLLLMLLATGTIGSFWNLHQREVHLSQAYPLQGTSLQTVTLSELRKLYSEEVVSRAKSFGMEATHDYQANERAFVDAFLVRRHDIAQIHREFAET